MMKTKKQKELVNSFLLMLPDDEKGLYQQIIVYLTILGYNPKKERTHISFKHSLHNKQIAKIGIKNDGTLASFFALRYSACKEYSKRFEKVISDSIDKFPNRVAACITKNCDYCAGELNTHVYTYVFDNEEKKFHCGAYALEVPNLTDNDLVEIKKLIKEEHNYLLKHEVKG